jgi:hypothetical protein
VSATVAVVLLLVSPFAGAGDEVDYSAPYLVVENGELVTKYPAREHAGTEETDPPATAESRALENASSGSRWWLIAALAGGAAAAGVGVAAQRQRRPPATREAGR